MNNNVNLGAGNFEVYTVNSGDDTYKKALPENGTEGAYYLTEGTLEDELVEINELSDGENEPANGVSGEQDEVSVLLLQYTNEMNRYLRLQKELIELERQKSSIEGQIIKAKDEDEKIRLQNLAENLGARISDTNGKLQASSYALSDINAQIYSAMSEDISENIEVSTQNTASGANSYIPLSSGNSGSASAASADSSNFSAQNVQYSGNTISKDLAARLDNRLGKGFSQKCEQVASYLGCNTNDLLAMMYSESGLKTDARNKSSNAIGLIQCIPSTLAANGYSTEQVAKMSAVEQLDVVADIFMKSKKMAGYGANEKIDGGTLYAINWLPAYAKKDTLAVQNGKYYSKGLDMNKDGSVTKNDLAQRLQAKYNEMLKNI